MTMRVLGIITIAIIIGLFCYCFSKIEIVCVPTGKHLNKDKYITMKEEIISKEPISTTRIYYIKKDTAKR